MRRADRCPTSSCPTSWRARFRSGRPRWCCLPRRSMPTERGAHAGGLVPLGPSRATDVVELWATPVPPSSWIRVGLAPGSVGWPMNPVYVLDVGFALPLMALARVQLLTGRSNGGRLAVVLLVFTPQLGLGILALGRFGSPSTRRIVASTTTSEIVWSRCPRMSATRPTSPATSSTDPAGPAAPTPVDPMSWPHHGRLGRGRTDQIDQPEATAHVSASTSVSSMKGPLASV